MTLDEASQQLIRTLAEQGGGPIHLGTPEQARSTGPLFAQLSGPGPDVRSSVEHRLETKDGGSFRLKVLTPSEKPDGIFVFYHGGGFMIGDIDGQYDHVGRQMANLSNCTVVLPEYRKAPEHRFPAAIDDSWQALQWVDEHRAELAPDGAPVFIGGDSAGGNITAVIAHRAQDAGGPELAGQVLVYPATDSTKTYPSAHAEENQLILGQVTVEWFESHYSSPEERTHVERSPLLRESLAGLPPAYVQLAEHDPLLDEGQAYADALQAAGVPTKVDVMKGQMHGFFQMANILPGSKDGVERVSAWIREQLGK